MTMSQCPTPFANGADTVGHCENRAQNCTCKKPGSCYTAAGSCKTTLAVTKTAPAVTIRRPTAIRFGRVFPIRVFSPVRRFMPVRANGMPVRKTDARKMTAVRRRMADMTLGTDAQKTGGSKAPPIGLSFAKRACRQLTTAPKRS